MAANIPEWAEKRLLQFLNRVQTPEDILNHPDFQDDPESGSAQGYRLGEQTVQNILDSRNTSSTRRFSSVEDVLAVPGLGEDKLQDLLHSFALTADDAFVKALFNELIQDNWELFPLAIDYPSEESFRQVVDQAESFRRAVAPVYAERFSYYSREAQRELQMRVHRSHQENYFEAHLASFPFAFWWYQFDQDNWFSFERIRGFCEDYLNYHGNEAMQFRMIHLGSFESIEDFRRSHVIPVVVNYAEFRVTIWDAQLND